MKKRTKAKKRRKKAVEEPKEKRRMAGADMIRERIEGLKGKEEFEKEERSPLYKKVKKYLEEGVDTFDLEDINEKLMKHVTDILLNIEGTSGNQNWVQEEFAFIHTYQEVGAKLTKFKKGKLIDEAGMLIGRSLSAVSVNYYMHSLNRELRGMDLQDLLSFYLEEGVSKEREKQEELSLLELTEPPTVPEKDVQEQPISQEDENQEDKKEVSTPPLSLEQNDTKKEHEEMVEKETLEEDIPQTELGQAEESVSFDTEKEIGKKEEDLFDILKVIGDASGNIGMDITSLLGNIAMLMQKAASHESETARLTELKKENEELVLKVERERKENEEWKKVTEAAKERVTALEEANKKLAEKAEHLEEKAEKLEEVIDVMHINASRFKELPSGKKLSLMGEFVDAIISKTNHPVIPRIPGLKIQLDNKGSVEVINK